MNIRKLFTIVLFLFITSFGALNCNESYHMQLISSPRGIELCDKIYSFLEQNDFTPEKQELLSSDENVFPYNIVININSKTNSNKNIIFTFFQEDVLPHSKIFIDFINYVKLQQYDFNTIFLFSYGEKETVKKQGMIYGIDSFLKHISTNDDNTSIIVDLSASDTSINTCSNGVTAPSWLIQNEYNSYIKYKIDKNIPSFYLSQIYTYDFFTDRQLSSFFDYDIPAIKLNFENKDINNELVYSVLKESIESYKDDSSRIWDQHFLMVKLFNSYKKLTEVGTIKIIILIIFSWLVFILLFIFINIRLKKQAWGSVKHIWYSAPISFGLIYLSILISKNIAVGFLNTSSYINNVIIVLGLQLVISILLVSIYYSITLMFNFNFYEKSIDYLIVLSCFVNQSVFILIDVSLFPIFMFICILSIIALSIKNNGLHIAIFFIMIIPFIPYLHTLFIYGDFRAMYNYITTERFLPFFISLIIVPSYLIYFRVLTSVKRNTKINIFILCGIIVVAISLFTIIFSNVITKSLKENQQKSENIKYYESYEKIVDLEYTDDYIFDDLIRTIDITFTEQPIQCSVNVTALNSSPILYTENDYDFISGTTSTFKIPSNPPKNLRFKYGTTQEPSLITISATFPTGNPNQYKSINKVVTIGK